jgi:hypothetical protein
LINNQNKNFGFNNAKKYLSNFKQFKKILSSINILLIDVKIINNCKSYLNESKIFI